MCNLITLSLLATTSEDFCRLLKIFGNSLAPDQDWRPDLGPNCFQRFGFKPSVPEIIF